MCSWTRKQFLCMEGTYNTIVILPKRVTVLQIRVTIDISEQTPVK